MSRDGSGTYSLPATMATASTVASSVTVNSIMDDIAQALTDSINKDGTKAFAANQSMGSNKLTALAAGTALTDAANLSQVQKSNVAQATTVAGTVDAITLAFTPAITSYTSGMVVRFVSAGANTSTTPTANIDGLGAKTIKKNGGGAALVAGDIGVSGSVHELQYNGTDFILLNPILNLSSYPTTADILGLQTIPVPAGSMEPRTTNGAAFETTEFTTNKVMQRALLFDPSTIEYAQFAFLMPKSWDEGTVTAMFIWMNAAGAGDVVWGIQGVALANGDAMDTAFGTAVEVTDTSLGTDKLLQSGKTAAITIAGAAGGVEEWVIFQVYRKASDAADTLPNDAKLLGVSIFYNTSALNDD